MKRKWFAQFTDFMNSSIRAPLSLTSKVLQQIKKDLEPAFSTTFQKFILSQLVAGVATLFVCPQFGVSLTKMSGHHFIHSVMAYGDWACAALCASIFIGASSLISVFVLSRAEMRVLRTKPLVSIALPPLVYLLVFIVMRKPDAANAEVFMSPSYLATWYLVAVGIVVITLFSKKRSLLH